MTMTMEIAFEIERHIVYKDGVKETQLHRFSCRSQFSKSNERREIAVQINQPVEVDHDAYQDDDHSRADLNLA